MPVSQTCPKCKIKLRVGDDLAGKKIKCPKCATIFPFSAPEGTAAITANAPASGPASKIKPAPDAVEELEEIEELEEVDELEELEEVEEPRRPSARNIRRGDDDDGNHFHAHPVQE